MFWKYLLKKDDSSDRPNTRLSTTLNQTDRRKFSIYTCKRITSSKLIGFFLMLWSFIIFHRKMHDIQVDKIRTFCLCLDERPFLSGVRHGSFYATLCQLGCMSCSWFLKIVPLRLVWASESISSQRKFVTVWSIFHFLIGQVLVLACKLSRCRRRCWF